MNGFAGVGIGVGIALLAASSAHAIVVRDYTWVSEATPFGADSSRSIAAVCPEGTETIAGGADVTAAGGARPILSMSRPLSGGLEGWIAKAHDIANDGGWRLTTTAICGRIPGREEISVETAFSPILEITAFVICLGGKRPLIAGVTPVGADLPRAIARSVPIAGDSWSAVVRRLDAEEWSLRMTGICVPPGEDVDVYGVSSNENPTTPKEASVVCPPGRTVLGGGAEVVDPFEEGALVSNGPHFVNGEIVGWHASAESLSLAPTDWELEVVVVCPEVAHAPLALLTLAAWARARLRLAAAAGSGD